MLSFEVENWCILGGGNINVEFHPEKKSISRHFKNVRVLLKKVLCIWDFKLSMDEVIRMGEYLAIFFYKNSQIGGFWDFETRKEN